MPSNDSNTVAAICSDSSALRRSVMSVEIPHSAWMLPSAWRNGILMDQKARGSLSAREVFTSSASRVSPSSSTRRSLARNCAAVAASKKNVSSCPTTSWADLPKSLSVW
ncbi:hypothetical protein D3C71_1639530 [compost metagenome]